MGNCSGCSGDLRMWRSPGNTVKIGRKPGQMQSARGAAVSRTRNGKSLDLALPYSGSLTRARNPSVMHGQAVQFRLASRLEEEIPDLPDLELRSESRIDDSIRGHGLMNLLT